MTDLEQKARTLVDNFETSCTGMEPEAHPLKDELAKRIAVAMQALVAAAYAACAEHLPPLPDATLVSCSCGAYFSSRAAWQAHIKSLTPADAARELEQVKAASFLAGQAGELLRIGCRPELLNADLRSYIEERQKELSKPAPVERSNENG